MSIKYVSAFLAIALVLSGCSAIAAAPAATAVPPTKAPATAIPATAVPPTETPIPPTETPIPPTLEPTSSIGLPAGCVDALTITTDMIGQTMCIGGIVAKQLGAKGDYYIYFSKTDFTKLYFFGPAWHPTITNNGAKDGDCVYIENAKIASSGTGGMIIPFIPKDLKHCNK
jgi:hypothetical protein